MASHIIVLAWLVILSNQAIGRIILDSQPFKLSVKRVRFLDSISFQSKTSCRNNKRQMCNNINILVYKKSYIVINENPGLKLTREKKTFINVLSPPPHVRLWNDFYVTWSTFADWPILIVEGQNNVSNVNYL